MPIELNETNFDTIVKNMEGLILIDFFAPWCGPCQRQMPIVEELENEISSKVKIATVNIDENQKLASEYNVQSVPTLFIFQNGQKVDKLSGLHSKSELLKTLNKYHS